MGWQIKRKRDTGWVDLTASIGEVYVSGRLLVRRVDDLVTVVFDDLVINPASSNTPFPRLDVGYRPFFARARGEWAATSSYTMGGTAGVTALGYFNVYNAVSGQAMSMRMVFDAAGAIPTGGA